MSLSPSLCYSCAVGLLNEGLKDIFSLLWTALLSVCVCQGVNDVLQERFAIEMRCNTALRLAALHIQERLASCGQSPKTNLKIIT